MSSNSLKRTAAVVCLAVCLAVPAQAVPTIPREPLGFAERLVAWMADLWAAAWEQAESTDEGPLIDPDGKPRPGSTTDEGHAIDPDG